MRPVAEIIKIAKQNQNELLKTPLEQALGLYYQEQTKDQGLENIKNFSLEDLVPEINQFELLWVLDFKISWDNLDSVEVIALLSKKHENDFLLFKAAENYARLQHQSINHKRKYSGEDYFVHLEEVQQIVASVNGTWAMQSAAMLHDVVEDVKVSPKKIEELFGVEIANLVEMLTDISKPTDGNRKIRKQKDLLHTAQASPEAKTIKLADLISNARSIVLQDPNFARVYMREKKQLLEVLKEGNQELYLQAKNLVDQYFKTLD